MNYLELNLAQKKQMRGTCVNIQSMEWEQPEFLDYLCGDLPAIRDINVSKNSQKHLYNLKRIYDSYNFFNTDKSTFLTEISKMIGNIQIDTPYWFGLNVGRVKDIINYQKICFISGEGGIGKSYFIYCLEEELEKRSIKHLCLYGKFTRSIQMVNFDEICSIAQDEEFVFICDAINELSTEDRLFLLEKLPELKCVSGLRIIITVRTHTIEDDVMASYLSIAGSSYIFPGVSFESALEWLQKIPLIDVSQYEDILYTNNPFLLSKLQFILNNKEALEESKNSVCMITYIYERYIKTALTPLHWSNTKKVARFMYENNKKYISIEELSSIIENCSHYLMDMQQQGFLNCNHADESLYCSFNIESLADYLIARSLWDDLRDKNITECSELIKSKTQTLRGVEEAIVLILFDKFSPDYQKIKDILIQSGLMERFEYDTVVKIKFREETISSFLTTFKPSSCKDLILVCGGFVDKPFNCTNYLNDYYLGEPQKHIIELSTCLSGEHFFAPLKGRLKNILYYICTCKIKSSRITEAFYFSLWCCASANTGVRNLAQKLLFETVQRSEECVHKAIELYPKIEDYYIQESIVFALSSCCKNSAIQQFFNQLLLQIDFTLAKSVRRISAYLGDKYSYITLKKHNYYSSDKADPSETFISLLHQVDLFEKHLLPFRYWGKDRIDFGNRFLAVNKSKISHLNAQLKKDFDCVIEDSACHCRSTFVDDIERKYSVSYKDEILESQCVLSSFEVVCRSVFLKYGLPFKKDSWLSPYQRFESSLMKKCVTIAVDLFYGSLMCNYYSDEFSTNNGLQECVGYEVYDPLEYKEELNLPTPIPVYQSAVEKMGDVITRKLATPGKADVVGAKDLTITKKNLMSLLTPIVINGYEWMMIAGRVRLQDAQAGENWEDKYLICCCLSDQETLSGEGDERRLTIDREDYFGNIKEYSQCTDRPWLCKSVPSICYQSKEFDDAVLVLPPAQMISALELSVDLESMVWKNKKGEDIIICNNNKASYYDNFVTGTIFIRKDAYDFLMKQGMFKFFAYVEKYIPETGYCEDTAYHFEIVNGDIVKAYPNNQREKVKIERKVPERCQSCPHGFFENIPDYSEEALEIIIRYIGESELKD